MLFLVMTEAHIASLCFANENYKFEQSSFISLHIALTKFNQKLFILCYSISTNDKTRLVFKHGILSASLRFKRSPTIDVESGDSSKIWSDEVGLQDKIPLRAIELVLLISSNK